MIEPEEEQEGKVSKISDKLGDIVIVQESARKNIDKITGATTASLRGKPQKKPQKTIKSMIIGTVPYGDERSIRKTIGATILLLLIIAAISAVVTAIITASTSLLNEFGFAGGMIAIFIGICIPVGIISFYVATANKHDREKHIEDAMKR